MFETTLTLPRTSVLTEPLGSAGAGPGPSTSTAAVAVQTSKRRRRRRNKRRRKSSLSSSTDAPSSRTYDPVMTGSQLRSAAVASVGGGSVGTAGPVRRGRRRSGVSSSSSAAAAAAAAAEEEAEEAEAEAEAARQEEAAEILSGNSSPSMFVDPQDFFETLD
ncbi:histone-lysine N-methyltransferase, H3 lysine-79 specific [Drosophila biarmipes]|uniref:histone-lysine N-methyltransferase, H3 lysine-79 specific n=1 Tax=Drosophila biarmipes TaxID=125945 RepID=UPI0007E87AD7|nr:histone-lysine N-methyltransferase, H3 lysine-79 specific [Drosophila biarmipes]